MAEEHVQVVSAPPVTHRPSDELRQLLDRLDNLVGILPRHDADTVAEIPAMMERAQTLMDRLKSRSKEFQAEEARLRTVQGQFNKQDGLFVKKLGATRIAQLRAAQGDPTPAEEHWWWYMDRLAAERRQAFLKKTAIGVAIAVLVLVAAVVIYQRFFAPDPLVVAAYEYRGRAEDLAYNGDYQAALAQLDEGLAVVPDNTELLILRGVVLDVLGEAGQAQAAYDAARATLPDNSTDFLILRAQEYIRLNLPDLGIADMQTLLETHPELAEAYYIMASAEDTRNDPQKASEYYALAAQYAAQNGNVQLEALARMQLANMSSRLLIPTVPPETATP